MRQEQPGNGDDGEPFDAPQPFDIASGGAAGPPHHGPDNRRNNEADDEANHITPFRIHRGDGCRRQQRRAEQAHEGSGDVNDDGEAHRRV